MPPDRVQSPYWRAPPFPFIYIFLYVQFSIVHTHGYVVVPAAAFFPSFSYSPHQKSKSAHLGNSKVTESASLLFSMQDGGRFYRTSKLFFSSPSFFFAFSRRPIAIDFSSNFFFSSRAEINSSSFPSIIHYQTLCAFFRKNPYYLIPSCLLSSLVFLVVYF